MYQHNHFVMPPSHLGMAELSLKKAVSSPALAAAEMPNGPAPGFFLFWFLLHTARNTLTIAIPLSYACS
jgi:hypothetical protein